MVLVTGWDIVIASETRRDSSYVAKEKLGKFTLFGLRLRGFDFLDPQKQVK